MNKIGSILGLSIATMVVALPASADNDPKKVAIKARQGEMSIRVFNAGPLFAMSKGDMPYDAQLAEKLANNLKVLLSLDNGRAWMPGTSTDEYANDTKALPKIWEKDSKIGDAAKKYKEAVTALAGDAGKGLDALKAKAKDLGEACKGCHDDFRKKEKN
ncbi:MAG: cytochrome c [Gammaproteobacteria bacterium]|nr:cytochrome c [Gammaproteobacteria bacterium]